MTLLSNGASPPFPPPCRLQFFFLSLLLSYFLGVSLGGLSSFLRFWGLFRRSLGVLGDFGVALGCLLGVFLKSLGVFWELWAPLGAQRWISEPTWEANPD